MGTNYSGIETEELRVMAGAADKAVKTCNIHHCFMRTNMWHDPEYLRLLAIADEIDSEVAKRQKKEVETWTKRRG